MFSETTSTDHPRSRGEYSRCPGRPSPMIGSSPLSRGILSPSSGGVGSGGIIPALAGNTLSDRPNQLRKPDHPRSRGEYTLSWCLPLPLCGSSPLSRGILSVRRVSSTVIGIIPALAGNTIRRDVRVPSPGDHPRSRGEYYPIFSEAYRPRGSSPLSRGIRNRPALGWNPGRIIPALAGNTSAFTGTSAVGGDHPRSRGEYHMVPSRSSTPIGSSPLSRGILARIDVARRDPRIIPALAGNTHSSGPQCCRSWDHPRSRGEYFCRDRVW